MGRIATARLRRGLESPLVATAVVIVCVAGAILSVRAATLLETVELAGYDWFMRLRPGDPPVDARILIVAVSEADIQRLGSWPLPDGVLAKALTTLIAFEPRAVGLDIYRDVPVPPGSAELDALLSNDRRVVVVMKFGGGGSSSLQPPAVLKRSEQVGFNDILVDPGGVVRRALLFLDDGQTVIPSLALRLTLLYLAAEGVHASADPRDPQLLRLGRTTIHPFEPNDGPYVGADARGYQMLLDFHGGGRPFATTTLGSVLDGTVDPKAVRGRIVLLGVTADSVKDDFYTPYSRGSPGGYYVPGVAVHAYAASQLLRAGLEGAQPIQALTEWQESSLIVLWAVGGGLLALWVRSPLRLSAVALAGVLGLGLGDFAAFLRGWWLPLVPPVIAWLTSAAGVTAWLAWRERIERAMLMQLFSRHVSREVAETIWRQRDQFLDGARPRPQGLTVTALFTDLSGYTAIAEKLGPAALMEWLNEYMDAMESQVSRHGGVIRQYAGDGILVLFGIPVARATEAEIALDALNAVNCALAMGERLRALNQRRLAEGRPIAGMRAGIFTGPAVSGTLGTQRSEYVVVGDTVNVASRLESLDKDLFAPDAEHHPCRIFIGEKTLRYLGSEFETDWVGDMTLKGKEQKVSVYRVTGRAASSAQHLEHGREV